VARFLTGRILRGIFTVFLVTLVVHGGLALLPGDPIRALFGQRRPDPLVLEAMRDQFDFNRPWIVQYLSYLKDLVTGDWGNSFPGSIRGIQDVGPPVEGIVAAAAPVSARLIAPVLAVQLVVGAAIGALAAVYRRRPAGTLIYLISVALLGIPVIALAYVLQMGFAWELAWVPTRGLDAWPSYVLPVTALSLTTTCLVILFARSHLRDVLRQPFIKATVARGIKTHRVVGLHAMKVSLSAFLSLIVSNLGQLITGLIIVETIFGIQGLGSVMFSAIYARDRPLLLALTILTTVFVTLANILADATHLLLDPRTQETL